MQTTRELNVMIVDGDSSAAGALSRLCACMPGIRVSLCCTDTAAALARLQDNTTDIAIIGLCGAAGAGLCLAREIRARRLNTEILFVARETSHAFAAYSVEAPAYLLQPVSAERLEAAIRRAARLLAPRRRRVFVRTFGRFDVFVEQEPLYFANAKAKELLAVLVDHNGGIVTMDTVVSLLWEDRPYDDKVKQLYRKAVNYLNKLFEEQGLDFFVSKRGNCFVKRMAFNCDLYDLLDAKPHAEDLFYGAYLFDYSWGEERLAEIEEMVQKRREVH